jgi:hypothetical protein
MTAAAEQTSDDELCLHVSDGHKWSFIVASLIKRTLQIPGLKAADRLDLLERLNKLTDSYFTADMLAGISPMCDTAYAIFKEARTLDPPQDDTHCDASFNVLATPSVFRHFVQLNPSIMAAIEQRAAGRRNQHAPRPTPDESPPRRPAAMGAAQFAQMQRRTNGVTQHRSHYPSDQINRMGGGLLDFGYDDEGVRRGS